MAVADELCTTPETQAALRRLRALAGADDSPMERHGVRMFLIASDQAVRDGKEVDRDVLLVAALLHDAGLYVAPAERGTLYVTYARRFAEEIGAEHGWAPDRITRCADAMEHHHELTAQWHRGNEAEYIRRTDLVDLFAPAAIAMKISRDSIRAANARVSRDGVYRYIGALIADEIRGGGPMGLARILRP